VRRKHLLRPLVVLRPEKEVEILSTEQICPCSNNLLQIVDFGGKLSVELLRDFAEKRGKKGRMSAPSHHLRQKLTPHTKIDGDDFADQNIQISVGRRYEI